MVVGIHQLHYLPWLRYFHKIASCDIFVALDNIQFNKNGWQNRNKIKNPRGWVYLTVPVIQRFQQNLEDVKIDNNTRWRDIHRNALNTNYGKSGYFKEYKNFFEEIYKKEWDYLNVLTYEMLLFFVQALGIKTKIIRSSELKVEGEDTTRLLNICKILGADTYLSGAYAARVYLEPKLFEEAGIKIVYQEWHCPAYTQQFNHLGFIPDLAIVDLLFNEGGRSLGILLNSR
jgi:hypothetical protein